MTSDKAKIAIGVAVLLISGFLLFSTLGVYALWDDETETTLAAEGVMLTGDTTSIIGHNLVARRAGINVRDLHDRFTPPLPIYLAAASMAIFGKTAWAARLPFALMGLATVALILHLLWRWRVSTLSWALMGIAIIGNVSFFLYFRQARYYGVVIFLAVLIGYIYLTWKGTRRQALIISLASAGLFLSNQICFLEVNAVLFIDYVIFRRRHISLRELRLPFLLIPQILIIVATSLVWNPFLTKSEDHLKAISLLDRVTLFWWNLRDLNQAEFGVGLLLVAGLLAFFLSKNQWILRGLIAIVLTVLVASVISHQTVSATSVADVRYIIPIIPICIAVGVMTIEAFTARVPWLAVIVAMIAFWTNALHGGLFRPATLRSTVADYLGELSHPPPEPYTPAYQWVARNVPDGASVWVLPENMIYPLMFHAPNAVYAWQLTKKDDPQFAKMDRIHFQGEVPPQYIIAFGPVVSEVARLLDQWSAQGVHYKHVTTLDTFWKDLYRPELFWRRFTPVTNYNKPMEAINIFQLQNGAISPAQGN